MKLESSSFLLTPFRRWLFWQPGKVLVNCMCCTPQRCSAAEQSKWKLIIMTRIMRVLQRSMMPGSQMMGKTLRITQLFNLTFFVLMTHCGDRMISLMTSSSKQIILVPGMHYLYHVLKNNFKRKCFQELIKISQSYLSLHLFYYCHKRRSTFVNRGHWWWCS